MDNIRDDSIIEINYSALSNHWVYEMVCALGRLELINLEKIILRYPGESVPCVSQYQW